MSKARPQSAARRAKRQGPKVKLTSNQGNKLNKKNK